ncbi:MAG: plastocyanin/azurin family copper-binding protein [Chloroflexota bacterium]
MHPTRRLVGFVLPLAAALVLGCGGAGPGWTFAPLGPTAPPSPSGGPTPGPSSSANPELTLDVITTEANFLAFEPATLEAPANTLVQVDYLNDSSLQHNIDFFNGPDQTAESLGRTEVVTGPGNTQSTTFSTPATAGDYYFWCEVHGAAMQGTLHVTDQ